MRSTTERYSFSLSAQLRPGQDRVPFPLPPPPSQDRVPPPRTGQGTPPPSPAWPGGRYVPCVHAGRLSCVMSVSQPVIVKSPRPFFCFVWLQITSRRMSQFNEGDKAREERQKYQKTAQVLTLFIASYIGQWWTWIVFRLWSFFDYPSDLFVSESVSLATHQTSL